MLESIAGKLLSYLWSNYSPHHFFQFLHHWWPFNWKSSLDGPCSALKGLIWHKRNLPSSLLIRQTSEQSSRFCRGALPRDTVPGSVVLKRVCGFAAICSATFGSRLSLVGRFATSLLAGKQSVSLWQTWGSSCLNGTKLTKKNILKLTSCPA